MQPYLPIVYSAFDNYQDYELSPKGHRKTDREYSVIAHSIFHRVCSQISSIIFARLPIMTDQLNSAARARGEKEQPEYRKY